MPPTSEHASRVTNLTSSGLRIGGGKLGGGDTGDIAVFIVQCLGLRNYISRIRIPVMGAMKGTTKLRAGGN